MNVEVVYAPNSAVQKLISLKLPAGYTVEQAIQQSHILDEFPEINLAVNKVGIFSKTVALSQIISENDRIEIYRPLKIDPKQARLLRAKRNKL